jgi:four helix bundle protein
MATGLENLWIYKLAEDLEIKIHEITKRFPKDEIFRTVDQIRRSSASVSNNMAESYHKSTVKEKKRFLTIAKGEAEETKRNILKSARKNFLPEKEANDIADQYTVLLKGTNSYIRFMELNSLENKPLKPETKN